MKFPSLRKTKSDYEESQWCNLLQAKISKEVGLYGDNYYNRLDPCSYAVQHDDLVSNSGTPKGFEKRTFYVMIEDVRDSRLTTKGLESLARQLRKEAFGWMVKEVKERGESDWLCCTTPQVLIHTAPPSGMTPPHASTTKLWICVKVYIFPRLKPDVRSAGDSK